MHRLAFWLVGTGTAGTEPMMAVRALIHAELTASDFCTANTGPSVALRSARQPNPLRSLLILLLSIAWVASMLWRPLL